MAKNTITLAQAQGWAKTWRANPNNVTIAHLIPGIDVTQIMADPSAVNIRAYLGIDENGVEKLMLVGVDANGNDLIDEDNEQYVYDFTTPCPSICSIDSPLFTLK